MYAARWFLSFLLLSLPLFAHAEKDPGKELAKQIKGQTLLLRTNYEPDVLAFDSQGNVKGSPAAGLFAWSGIYIESVETSSSEWKMKGTRALLISPADTEPPTADSVKLVSIEKRKVSISIDRDTSHPEAEEATFHRVFANSVADALSSKTPSETQDALTSLPSLAPTVSRTQFPCKVAGQPAGKPLAKPADGIAAPRLIHSVDPVYPPKQRQTYTGGTNVLNVVVDREGRPDCIRIDSTLGPEFDQSALIAVSQFRFSPALKQGEPVPVELHVQMSFHAW